MFITITLVAMAAMGPASESAPTQWVDYHDAAGRFHLRMPEGWTVRLVDGGTLVVSEDDSQNVAACIATRFSAGNAAARQAASAFVEALRTSSDALKIGAGRSTPGNPETYSCGVALGRGGEHYLGRLTVYHHQSGLLQCFYYQADVARFAELEPVLRRVLSSCRLDRPKGVQGHG